MLAQVDGVQARLRWQNTWASALPFLEGEISCACSLAQDGHVL